MITAICLLLIALAVILTIIVGAVELAVDIILIICPLLVIWGLYQWFKGRRES